MATEKPRFSVTFTESSYEKIQKYQKKNNISTQSKAVARLVELALNEIESENKTTHPPSTDESEPGEEQIIILYRQLNEEGQDKVIGYADDLVSSGKYIKNNPAKLGNEKMA